MPLAFAAVMGGGAGACDFFTPADHNDPKVPPPYVHVIAANVGSGLPALPSNAVMKITFDRYIDPLTLNRQGIALRDLFGGAPGSPIIQYDPVTRTATLSNPTVDPKWLLPGQTYEISFPIATDEAGSFGLRAIDGATMDPATQTIAFAVTDPLTTVPTPPVIDFCIDIFPLFAATRTDTPQLQGKCSNVACHGVGGAQLPYAAAQGLVLQTEEGIRHTAIGVLAVETSTSALTTPITAQTTFPVGMPIIAPGSPGESYLLYKLLLPDLNGANTGKGPGFSYTAKCGAVTPPFDYGPGASLASADEAARLGALVPGKRMPWGDLDDAGLSFTTTGGTPLTIDELERISLWIAEGANVTDGCGTQCPATH